MNERKQAFHEVPSGVAGPLTVGGLAALEDQRAREDAIQKINESVPPVSDQEDEAWNSLETLGHVGRKSAA
jgi:hypothetical protein